MAMKIRQNVFPVREFDKLVKKTAFLLHKGGFLLAVADFGNCFNNNFLAIISVSIGDDNPN